MKVDIQRGTGTTGLIFKKTYPTVTLTVQFTEEERHIIEKNHLTSYCLVERPTPPGQKPDPGIWNLHVFNIIRGQSNEFMFEFERDANLYQDQVIPALKRFKDMIEELGRPREQSVSVEL